MIEANMGLINPQEEDEGHIELSKEDVKE